MCQLTDAKGDFWRRVHAHVAEPVRFMGYVFHRDHAAQALYDKQAVRRADAALRQLRALEANDKAVFDALESLSYAITHKRPELRAALCDAYRAGDHAELGRIVADEIRAELEEQAEDAAIDDFYEVEDAERRELERSAA